jgi:hypothetical protein
MKTFQTIVDTLVKRKEFFERRTTATTILRTIGIKKIFNMNERISIIFRENLKILPMASQTHTELNIYSKHAKSLSVTCHGSLLVIIKPMVLYAEIISIYYYLGNEL